jgi:hypothetical protein
MDYDDKLKRLEASMGSFEEELGVKRAEAARIGRLVGDNQRGLDALQKSQEARRYNLLGLRSSYRLGPDEAEGEEQRLDAAE